jgi:hypothetical protein
MCYSIWFIMNNVLQVKIVRMKKFEAANNLSQIELHLRFNYFVEVLCQNWNVFMN